MNAVRQPGIVAPDGAGRLSGEMPRLALIVPLLLLTAACGTGAPESMAIGSPAPDFALQGTDGKAHSLVRLLQQPRPRCRLHVQSLSGVAAVRSADREAPRGLPEPGRCGGGDQPRQSEGPSTRRAEPHRRRRFARRHEGASGAPAPCLPVSLGRRDAVPRQQFKVVATPQIFVFDKDRTLRYQGRIDDQRA